MAAVAWSGDVPLSPREPPPSEPRGSRPLKAVAYLLLAAGTSILAWFVVEPTSPMPGFPRCWKGGPAILTSCFLCQIGMLVLIQRRFALQTLLFSALTSGLLAAATQCYVSQIRSTCVQEESIPLKADRLGVVVGRGMEELNTERLLDFVADAYSAGRHDSPPAFDRVQVGLKSSSTYDLESKDEFLFELTFRFEFSKFIHPDESSNRRLAMAYGVFLAKWFEASVNSAERDPERCAKALPAYLDALVGEDVYEANAPQSSIDEALLTLAASVMVSDEIIICVPFFPTSKKEIIEPLEWLAAREPDPQLKEFLAQTADEIRKLSKIHHPKDPSGSLAH